MSVQNVVHELLLSNFDHYVVSNTLFLVLNLVKTYN